MQFNYEEIKKAFENPMNGEYARLMRKNLKEGLTKATDYHVQMLSGGKDAMVRVHEFWMQGVDWYIESQKKITSFMTDKLTTEDN